MADISPCAVCGQDVSSDYKCPGPRGRSFHHFCGTRLGDTREDPQHGEPILCNTCETPNEEDQEDDDGDVGEDEEDADDTGSDGESMKAAEVAEASITQPKGQATLQLMQASVRGIKRKNTTVRDNFDICEGTGPNEGKSVCICKLCKEVVQVAKVVNASKLTLHLTVTCKCCPAHIKESASESTQRAKKRSKGRKLKPASGKSLGEETLKDSRDSIKAAAVAVAPTPTKAAHVESRQSTPRAGKHQASIAQFGQLMTKETAERLQRFDVEASLVRFEPLSRFDDPFVKASIIAKCPGITPFLLTSQYALDVMTPEIDREVACEVERICASTLGDANYSVEGVTVNSRSNLLVTRSVGSLTNFVDMVQLGDQVHVSASEAAAICSIIEVDMRKLERRRVSSVRIVEPFEMASLAVDNAAASMAKQVFIVTA